MDKLRIIVPSDSFVKERKYIVRVLFNTFLGLDYNIETSEEATNHLIILPDNKRYIEINNGFRSSVFQEGSYLLKENIPAEIIELDTPFSEKAITGLFGDNQFQITDEKIYVGVDIFASAFFMLTRWEEYVNTERDEHSRFPAHESVAYKFNFLNRPIVDEYVEFIWNILTHEGYKGKRKKRHFEPVLTHDVDWLSKPFEGFRQFVGDIVKRFDFRSFYRRFKNQFVRNPYDTFDLLMDQSEKLGVKSRFYFMADPDGPQYYLNSSLFQKAIKKINDRGHIIGFHPGYQSYLNSKRWGKEKKRLEESLGKEITEGRQHFLRFKVPETWNIWAENGIKTDSTLGYADYPGFRCGTCHEYPVFDFIRKIELDLYERPLIVMEGTLFQHLQMDNYEAIERVKPLIDQVKRYRGKFVLLWHNSSFGDVYWSGYEKSYYKIIELLKY